MRLFAYSATLALGAKVTPVEKVVVMLKEMVVKGQDEKAKEAAVFDEIEKTVNQRILDTGIEIEQNTDRVAKRTAEEAAAGAEASKLEGEVAEHEQQNAKNREELSAKTKQRKEERALFNTELQDLSESEDALTRAIGVLQSQEGSIPASLVQQISAAVPAAKANLEAYLQQPQASKEAYGFQSGGIVKMLKDLLKEFKEKLHDTRTAEMNKENAFQTWKSDMEYEIKGLDKTIADKTAEAGEQRGMEGKAKGKKEEAQGNLDAAKKLKKETELYFQMQSKSFKQNQELRTGELAALAEAIKVMSSAEVSGASEKHMPGDAKAEAFLQLRSSVEVEGNPLKAQLLQKATKIIDEVVADRFPNNKSKALAMVQAQLLTGGTFDKVINMIESLIKKLEEEASAELEHKQWCDKEMKLTGEDKDKYQNEVESKTAEKEGLEATLGENEAEIKQLEEELAELAQSVNQSTAERSEQKATNEETIAEAKAAQTATGKAIEVLENFYANSGSSEAFLQTKQDPEIASYGGMTGASGGVIGLMETIQSDFAQLESDTSADESAAAAEYAAFMKMAKKNKEEKEETVHKTRLENTALSAQIRRVAKSLKTSSEQLESVTKYSNELQPMCVVKHVSYEERVAQREEEIQALKDAYQVLSDQSGEV